VRLICHAQGSRAVLYRSSSSKVFPPLDTFPRRHIGVTDASVQVRPSASAALAPPASSSLHRHSRVTDLLCWRRRWWWAAAVQEMLSELQLKSIDELVHKTVPANILREPLNFNETGTAFSELYSQVWFLVFVLYSYFLFGRQAGILAGARAC
jgi:hypothetical protein